MDRKEGPTLNILNKNHKNRHTHLCMSFFFCNFAAQNVEKHKHLKLDI